MKNPFQVIITTKISHKEGTGHFRRSLLIARQLIKEDIGVTLILSKKNPKQPINLPLPIYYFNPKEEQQFLIKNQEKILLLIADKGDIETLLYHRFSFITMSLDNQGKSKHYFDYLINPLPHPNNQQSLFSNLKYLILPEGIKKYQKPYRPKSIQSILICFGGSDPFDLSSLLFQGLTQETFFHPFKITLILGSLYKGKLVNQPNTSSHPITLRKEINDLSPFMNHHDLFIGSFGLTPFEALYIGCYTFLVNHTKYHQSLSQLIQIPSSSCVGKKILPRTCKEKTSLLQELKAFIQNPFYQKKIELQEESQLFPFLKQIIKHSPPVCSLCGGRNIRYLERTSEGNRFQCQEDKTIMTDSFVGSLS